MVMRTTRVLGLALLLLLGTAPGAVAGGKRTVAALPQLRLDQIQQIGSHNSYRPYPSPEAQTRILTLAPEYWEGLAYGHPPIETQLALGIRQIELDVVPDPTGGLYAAPYHMALPALREVMTKPGAKVLHFPQFDIESHCLSFRACLDRLRTWSQGHPGHDAITVLVNASDIEPIPGFWPNAARFDAATLDALDTDIRETMGRERLIVPDDVRGSHVTLRDAVLAHAWPRVAETRGRFLFVLDGNDRHEQLYREGHPSLQGRIMFGFYPEGEAEAAIFNIQDPRGPEQAHIHRLVRLGYLVRTRADADTREARKNDHSRLDAALASGAQYISSDYYDGVPDPLRLSFHQSIGGVLRRCNPATAAC
jgi:hypothetical protein